MAAAPRARPCHVWIRAGGGRQGPRWSVAMAVLMRALQVVVLPTLTYAYNNGVSRTPPLGTRNWSSGASDPEVELRDSIRERERLPQRDPSACQLMSAALLYAAGYLVDCLISLPCLLNCSAHCARLEHLVHIRRLRSAFRATSRSQSRHLQRRRDYLRR